MSMRKFIQAMLPAAIALAATPAHAEWLEARSGHFIVYGDMTEAALREQTSRLSRFDGALRGLFKLDATDVSTLYVLGSMADVAELAGSSRVAGFYRGTAEGSLGIVPLKTANSDYALTPEQILFHEYTHHILLSTATEFFPGWASEGLAELFGAARFDGDGNVIIGAPIMNRGFAMVGMTRWTVKRLIESDANPPKGEEGIERYSRGWLMCHYLLLSGKRQGQFFAYIKALNEGAKPMDAATKVFGNLDKLDGELEAYLHGQRLPSARLGKEQIKAPAEITIRPLSPGEAAMMPHRIVSANGVSEKTAGPLEATAAPIAARWPADARVQTWYAEMAHDAKKYDLSSAAADRVLAVDPANVRAMVYKGRAAAHAALDGKDPARWKEARSWFLKANRANPDYALPFVLWYDSFVAAGDPVPPAAVNGLLRAVVLVPDDPGLRARAGVELIRQGDIATAKTVLAPLAYNPHASDKNPYAKLVKTIDEGASKDALIARTEELKIAHLSEFVPPPKEDGEKGDKKPD